MTVVHLDELDRLPFPPITRARLAFAGRGLRAAARDAFRARALGAGGGTRLVAIDYDRSPPLRTLIDDAVDQLAALALALFPDWYGADSGFAALDAGAADFEAISADRLGRLGLLRRGVSPPWLKAARTLCRRGEPPRPPGFPTSVHAAQLVRTIAREPLWMVLTLDDESADDPALAAFAHASAWLAREAGARVVAIVPESLSSSTALDPVSFDAVHVRDRGSAAVPPAPLPPRPRVAASPLIGRPNPASRGELLLAKRLEADAELAGLFQYNVHVAARGGSSPLVDLAWSAKKFVVEVDGFYYHSDAAAFSRDRRRDYELLVSGYRVLRLPEDEVVDDVELAVEKIRDVVAFLNASGRSAPPSETHDAP